MDKADLAVLLSVLAFVVFVISLLPVKRLFAFLRCLIDGHKMPNDNNIFMTVESGQYTLGVGVCPRCRQLSMPILEGEQARRIKAGFVEISIPLDEPPTYETDGHPGVPVEFRWRSPR